MSFKSGFVAVVGRPNVGKSTLVNRLVGQKVTITSSRPQTTRNAVRGVAHLDDAQIVLVDTPGLHKPKVALGERLNRLVYGTLAETDAAVLVVEANNDIGPGDRTVAARLAEAGTPTVVAVNKVDRADKAQVAAQLAEAGEWDFSAYVPLAARTGEGVDALAGELVAMLPEGPAYFPPDMVTDQPDELVAAELVREKYLARLRDELPHSLAVRTEEMAEREGGTLYIAATVVVERESQKGIAIGKKGEQLKAVGQEARRELESFFAVPVYLDLRVKVEKNWQRRPELLDRLGF